jgi:hypothetical protein
MQDEAKRAALDALRRAIAQLMEASFAELREDRRPAFLRALKSGYVEAVAVLTPVGEDACRLDARLNIVTGDGRHELISGDAEYRRAHDVTVN